VLAVARTTMAVVAIHTIVTCVDLVAKRNRLGGLVVLLHTYPHEETVQRIQEGQGHNYS